MPKFHRLSIDVMISSHTDSSLSSIDTEAYLYVTSRGDAVLNMPLRQLLFLQHLGMSMCDDLGLPVRFQMNGSCSD